MVGEVKGRRTRQIQNRFVSYPNAASAHAQRHMFSWAWAPRKQLESLLWSLDCVLSSLLSLLAGTFSVESITKLSQGDVAAVHKGIVEQNPFTRFC